jgi:hypothetical protein
MAFEPGAMPMITPSAKAANSRARRLPATAASPRSAPRRLTLRQRRSGAVRSARCLLLNITRISLYDERRMNFTAALIRPTPGLRGPLDAL